jgi:hypothetical protein
MAFQIGQIDILRKRRFFFDWQLSALVQKIGCSSRNKFWTKPF